jgi:uncharacterized phage infection (PIP) family protein YhgE
VEDKTVELPSGTDASSEPTPTDAHLTAADNARQKIEQELKVATTAVLELQRLFTDAQAKLAEITNASAEVAAMKSKVLAEQKVVASRSGHIQDAQKHADKVRAELDRVLTAATQQVTAAEAEKSKAQVAADHSLVLKP